ncbi:zinc finger MYM-type protein 1-like [Scomber scombrus]|uniref:Zinc finger MYM-type protein 1-like n=1 Tax=Scomber scombrus TaxID=13677 RepID=A0AAV1Q097_SCOSC
MKRFLISNKRKRTTSPKSDPRGKTDNIPDLPLDSNNNFVEADGTTAISDGPTRPPSLEAAATVTDVEKDTVMESSGSSTSESDGESLTPRTEDVLPAAGKPTSGAEDTPRTAYGPHDLSQIPDEGPRRPIRSFPKQTFGTQRRSFNGAWYEQYGWMEYSVTNDAVLCFSCRHFIPAASGFRSEPAFTVSGFQNWRKAQECFKAHNVSAAHKYSMQTWSEFKQRKQDGSKITKMLGEGHSKLVQENREYMKAVVESLRYTACQGIAQRGHREHDQAENKVANKISKNPSNAKYTHHEIQNEIFNIMADMVRKQISEEIKEAGHFAIMVDESKDISKKEQISVVVRYLHNETVLEEFLNFTPADGLDADSLLTSIKMTLSQCNIDVNSCIGQCYDGAAVMAGCINGVQEKFRKEQELDPSGHVELKKLSDTRWACQYSALCAIKKTLPAIQATLQDIIGQTNAKRKAEARALHGLIDEQFVLNLTLFEDVFRVTKFASDQLQAPNLDISSASDLVQSVITTLLEKRSEEAWDDIKDNLKHLCERAGIALQSRPPYRRGDRQQSSRLMDFVVEAPINRGSTSDESRTNFFYPVIDRLVNELRKRFSTDAGDVLSGVSALNPKHKSFLDQRCLLTMAHNYGITEDNLNAELHQVRRLLERKSQQGHSVTTTLELLTLMAPYKDAFTDLYKLLCISLTLPVTSASCERSFSCLRRLKNYLRSTSGDARSSNLGLLAINIKRARALNVDKIIDAFALSHNNRRIVLL